MSNQWVRAHRGFVVKGRHPAIVGEELLLPYEDAKVVLMNGQAVYIDGPTPPAEAPAKKAVKAAKDDE